MGPLCINIRPDDIYRWANEALESQEFTPEDQMAVVPSQAQAPFWT